MSGIADRLKAAVADRYLIERELGAGDMATVYLAEDLRHGRKFALETDAKVNEIAYGVGFKSVPHSSRKFREHFGMTPTAYRQSRELP